MQVTIVVENVTMRGEQVHTETTTSGKVILGIERDETGIKSVLTCEREEDYF